MIPIAKPIIGEEEISAVIEVLRSGAIAEGQKVKDFEVAFADYVGTSFAVAVNSGTAALHAALLAHGIGNGMKLSPRLLHLQLHQIQYYLQVQSPFCRYQRRHFQY